MLEDHNRMVVRLTIVLLLMACPRSSNASEYTHQMFLRAMAKDNPAVSASYALNSPLYVLITICDATGRPGRLVCVPANFLSGAIHIEHGLLYDKTREKKEYDIAARQRDHLFCFTKRKARDNIFVRYTPAQLERVRRQLAHIPNVQLRAEVDREASSVTRIYRRMDAGHHDFWQSDGYMEAVAHVLLERGILVGQTHWGPVLYLDKPSNDPSARLR
jgi:hypothetical protein